ncbi:MAG: hypothetical protein AAF515_09870 [Pseudomonadota bacterium]
MTQRSRLAHWIAERRARLMTALANRMFATDNSVRTRLVKRLTGVNEAAEHVDPELEHPEEPEH